MLIESPLLLTDLDSSESEHSSLSDDSSWFSPFDLDLVFFLFFDFAPLLPFLSVFFRSFERFFSTLEFAVEACIWRAILTPFMISTYFFLGGYQHGNARPMTPDRNESRNSPTDVFAFTQDFRNLGPFGWHWRDFHVPQHLRQQEGNFP
jgi:hypothetical protein